MDARSQEINEQNKKFYKQVSDFMTHVKNNPKKTAKDAIKFSSRALTNAVFYGFLYFAIINPITTSVATAATTVSTVAKEIFTPATIEAICDGAAALKSSSVLIKLTDLATAFAGEVSQVAQVVVEAGKELAQGVAASMGKGGGGGGGKITVKTPFEIAQAGGKHWGFWDNYKDRSAKEIASGIKSLKKQIIKHQDCIQNPTKHYPNFYDLHQKKQTNLINVKWPEDIARQKEHLNILEELLKLKK